MFQCRGLGAAQCDLRLPKPAGTLGSLDIGTWKPGWIETLAPRTWECCATLEASNLGTLETCKAGNIWEPCNLEMQTFTLKLTLQLNLGTCNRFMLNLATPVQPWKALDSWNPATL
jgi:hypothetical protein